MVLISNFIYDHIIPISLRPYFRSLYSLFKSLISHTNNNNNVNNNNNSNSNNIPQAIFDPYKPSLPMSYPLKTLEELETRSYFNSFHFPFNVSTVPIQIKDGSAYHELRKRGRILVCHDMGGGYNEDKWIQGGTNGNAYAIWHWYLIDVFVYFSHTLVTIPPPSWTNAAHKHGVKVLGTFMAEWDEGRNIANKLLSTEESAKMYAECLVELATALGFDGWLINMEVNLDVKQIPNLKLFVSHLTETMHSSLPGSLVIWYDSVTTNGDLNWQNQLNDSNKPFFDRSDGIFINYSWKKYYPRSSAAVAGSRKFDVYMGIDVFGRKTYGGGQWNTNIALDVLKKDDVSAAIFAPGWVYETEQPSNFETAQNRWWSLVEKSWGIVQRYPQVLPFYSNFDQGRGYHLAIDGIQVSNSPWNDISSQAFQPFLEFSEDSSEDPIQVLVDLKQPSYSGGGNITFKGALGDKDYFTTRLFCGKLVLGDSPINFKYSVQSDGTSLIGLSLELSSNAEIISILLASGRTSLLSANQFSKKFSKIVMPCRVTKPNVDSKWFLQESSIAMRGYTLTDIHAITYCSTPEHYEIQSSCSKDVESTSACGPKEYLAILGHITIETSGQNIDFPPSASWLVEGHYIKWTSGFEGSKTLSIKVSWKLRIGHDLIFPQYNIFVEKLEKKDVENPKAIISEGYHFLGVALVKAFYVSDLVVPVGTSTIKFMVQVCGADGTCQRINDSPSFGLSTEGS